MRSDRELLELAAKAAGLTVWRGQWPQDDMLFASAGKPDPAGRVTGIEWDPRTDDGDALRLAVKLNIDHGNPGMRLCIDWSSADDPYAATRRAIVRAAAEIGAKMQEE